MKGHGAKFSRKMEEAVAALLTQRNVDEAARAVGIGPATLLRWQKEPEFQRAYREARRSAYAVNGPPTASEQRGRNDAIEADDRHRYSSVNQGAGGRERSGPFSQIV